MNLEINNQQIEASFDRIAKDLLLQKALFVNEKIFRFTEIEFYYFHQDFHQDNYTHKHNRDSGEWRSHKQGLDITFNGDTKSDGGILIRGILVDNDYINGPIKSVNKIFEAFGSITNTTTFTIKDANLRDVEIIKTFRHLPNKVTYDEFHKKHYRYLTDLKELKIPEDIKSLIEKDNSTLL